MFTGNEAAPRLYRQGQCRRASRTPRDREAEERFERERRVRARQRPRLFDIVAMVLMASAALVAQEHRTDALDEVARDPPADERSGYIVAVPALGGAPPADERSGYIVAVPTLGGAHVSPRFAQSVINAVRRLVDRMVEEDRTQRRLASALGSPLTSSAPSNWWNWPLTGGVDSVRDGVAPTDGPPGP